MPRCFVIQPFDGGQRYDKRYEDVFEPAIRDAGLEPYRVDRDPSVSVPIENIERGIKTSAVCLAEISTDNPNVWFELGYAIANKCEVVLLCSDERDLHFPFDVRHRSIVKYPTESTSDFEKARAEITERLKAVLIKREQLDQVSSLSSVSKVEGLEQYEIAGLVAVAEEVNDPEDGISAWVFSQNMKQAGFTQVASNLALSSLLDGEILERFEYYDRSENSTYPVLRITPKGMKWLLVNKANLNLQIAAKAPQGVGVTEDDIPW